MPVLEVKDLWVSYTRGGIRAYALRGINMSLERREVMGVVGESGSGKSTLGHAVAGLLPPNSIVERGSITLEGKDLTKMRDLFRVRGTGVFVIFQDPMTSLNPIMKVKDQLAEALQVREERESLPSPFIRWSRRRSLDNRTEREFLEALTRVRFRSPQEVLEKYPHQLSGGERQRVMIAMAYILRPKVLVADEPTTALDVITQAQVMKMLLSLREEQGTAILLISHDVMLVSKLSDRMMVMYGGMVMEEGSSEELTKSPLHPYTKGLLASVPTQFKGEGRVKQIPGYPPNIFSMPQGCPFHPRCEMAMEVCRKVTPQESRRGEHNVSCHLYG
jgi:peptide/nickel transport system ATP-binding protein